MIDRKQLVRLSTAAPYVKAPLVYRGKVRELYDLGETYLIVVTDRISAFDFILEPAIPDKGKILNGLSIYWFKETSHIVANHIVHTDIEQVAPDVTNIELLRERIMVVKKTKRIDIECVVRGYLTGAAWRQYLNAGTVNGARLPVNIRKNEQLPQPLFTPAFKKEIGHDEDITFTQLQNEVGGKQAEILRDTSIRLYKYAHEKLLSQGIILADCKFEFGLLEDGELLLIDELFTPDCSRFWAIENYGVDQEIESLDKELVRKYLLNSNWDQKSRPDPLPETVVKETSKRYWKIYHRVMRNEAEADKC